MDYETLIFEPAGAAVPAIMCLFVIVTILDYFRTMIFYNN